MPVQESPLEAGYHQMYNLEFDQAHRTFDAWKTEHPDDPLGPASMAAAYLFAEFDRLHVLQSEFFMHDENFRGAHRALAPAPGTRALFYGEVGLRGPGREAESVFPFADEAEPPVVGTAAEH
jgi:hypothetical protein